MAGFEDCQFIQFIQNEDNLVVVVFSFFKPSVQVLLGFMKIIAIFLGCNSRGIYFAFLIAESKFPTSFYP